MLRACHPPYRLLRHLHHHSVWKVPLPPLPLLPPPPPHATPPHASLPHASPPHATPAPLPPRRHCHWTLLASDRLSRIQAADTASC